MIRIVQLAVSIVAVAAVGWRPSASCSATAARRNADGGGAAGRAWEKIEKECRTKLEGNKTAAAMRCLDGHFLSAREPGKRDGDWHTTLRKLRHDTEMFTWLESKKKVKPEVKRLWRGIYQSAKEHHESKPDKVFQVQFQEQNDDRKLWQQSNNKAVYIDPSGKDIPKRTVRAKPAALQGLEATFISTGHAVTDRFLTDKALKSLKTFLRASTFYFYQRPGYHLVALLEDGLASPLLAQIADGVRHALPTVLGSLPLTGARAYKADNSPLPTNSSVKPPLADDSASAAVSVLIWTVPASAQNDPANSALILRRRSEVGPGRATSAKTPQAAEDTDVVWSTRSFWDEDDEDADEDEEVALAAAVPARINYKANRAVFWSGNVEPDWNGPGWQKGFEERGIHLLLSFGWSEC